MKTRQYIHGMIYFIGLSAMAGSLSACSVDASLESLNPVPLGGTVEDNRHSADFIGGEVVTTSNGYVLHASFAETSEKRSLSNGYQIEGAFYE